MLFKDSRKTTAISSAAPVVAVIAAVMAAALPAHAGSGPTDPGPYPGWTLHSTFTSNDTHLRDLDGTIVHTWSSSYPPGTWLYLLDEGDLIRAGRDIGLPGPFGGGFGGHIERFDWDGNRTWHYILAGAGFRQHHDLEPLPNGNVLAIVWIEYDDSEAIAAGRDPANLGPNIWSERIVEIKPTGPTTGEIVWQWDAWDHLIQDFDPAKPNFGNPADHPERIDINYGRNNPDADWLHFNAIDYNEELNQIIISNLFFDEMWIISKDPGDPGDLLYRWGNPQAYGMGTPEDQQLFGQHDTHWITEGLRGEGNILLYNNGQFRPDGQYSSVDEIVLPLNPDGTYHREPGQPFGPAAPVWTCDNIGGDPFYAQFISGAQRLPNGNTLIDAGQTGDFYEVTEDCRLVWHLNPDGGFQFRATRVGIRDTRLRGLLWCPADIAEPYGVLDLADTVAFIEGYIAQGPLSDLAEPHGMWDTLDIQAFIDAFFAGCP